jgi:hypothetical protein
MRRIPAPCGRLDFALLLLLCRSRRRPRTSSGSARGRTAGPRRRLLLLFRHLPALHRGEALRRVSSTRATGSTCALTRSPPAARMACCIATRPRRSASRRAASRPSSSAAPCIPATTGPRPPARTAGAHGVLPRRTPKTPWPVRHARQPGTEAGRGHGRGNAILGFINPSDWGLPLLTVDHRGTGRLQSLRLLRAAVPAEPDGPRPQPRAHAAGRRHLRGDLGAHLLRVHGGLAERVPADRRAPAWSRWPPG